MSGINSKLSAMIKAQSVNKKTISRYYEKEYSQYLDNKFEAGANVYTVKMEYPYASKEYIDLRVRLSSVTTKVYGYTFGDDYKTMSFGSVYDYYPVGTMFKFEDNDWLAYNPDLIKQLGNSLVVRRCNNILKWVDRDTGDVLEVPCCIDNTIWGNVNTDSLYITRPKGYIKVYVQRNKDTMKIKPNYRFLFGNTSYWNAYRVAGGGVDNIINIKTNDNEGPAVLMLTLLVDYVDESRDDIVNGVADVNLYNNEYEPEPQPTSKSRVVISPDVLDVRNGDTVNFSLTKYVNNVITPTKFTFSIQSGPSQDSYSFFVTGDESFGIKNRQMDMSEPLVVVAEDSDGSSYTYPIWLVGW